MAPPTTIGTLTDELAASLIPTNIQAAKLRKLKDGFSRKLKHHNYARTNQFEVSERLGGLQEKFLVLNYDELANALHVRLKELKSARDSSEKWLPDVLHLLLQLSDDPGRKTKVEDLVKVKRTTEVVPALRWADIEADDPVDRKSQIWRDEDFSDLSSDEDSAVSVGTSSPESPEKNKQEERHYQRAPYLVDRDTGTDQKSQLDQDRLWNNDSNSKIVITELQAVREALFMLQGLPTTLFWRVDSSVELDRRYHLDHLSDEVLLDLLTSFGHIGLSVDVVRRWCRGTQTMSFMQNLRAGIEKTMNRFDSSISRLQSSLLNPGRSPVISLAATLEEVIAASKTILQIANLVDRMRDISDDVVGCLEILYEKVCSCQASGEDDNAQSLYELFLDSFTTYLKPIIRWITGGELDATATHIFIISKSQSKALTGLWQDWFSLVEGSGPRQAPPFMRPLVRKIFITGKTMIFLRHLQSHSGTVPSHAEVAFSLAELRSLQPSGLVPFSESFETTLERAVDTVRKASCSILRDKLGSECGLWRTIDAFDYVYLAKSGFSMDAIDAKIFELIDKGSRAWNDRFLIAESCLEVFGRIEHVDAERLRVLPSRTSTRDLQSQRRSVKMLSGLSLDYNIPWPIANVIPRSSLPSYQRVATLLLQIRRARYVLERGCRVSVMAGRLDLNIGQRNLTQQIYFQLQVFVNCLYDHFTSDVIESTTNELRLTLAAAPDVDEMIIMHQSYISKLETLCMTSNKMSTIRQAVTVLLDLCIRFSDTATSPLQQRRSSDVEALSFRSAASRPGLRRQPNDDDFSEEESEGEEGFSTFITFDEESYESILKDIRTQFDRQRSFIVAGLRSLSRVEEKSSSWELLAERLDWKKSTPSR